MTKTFVNFTPTNSKVVLKDSDIQIKTYSDLVSQIQLVRILTLISVNYIHHTKPFFLKHY